MNPELKKFSIVKPSIDTPFHIDFSWWKQHDSNWRIFLVECLCAEHKPIYENQPADITIDWVDPETAEVTRLDGIQNVVMNHCAKQPGFISHEMPMVDGVFRVFLSNGNQPMSLKDLAAELNFEPRKMLSTLGSGKVYQGIRPFQK